MSDPLSRATSALKELHDDAPPPPPGTREAVLERAAFARRERRVSRAILVPLAATLLLLATWAVASGNLARVLGSSRGGQDSEAPVVTPPLPPAPVVSPPKVEAPAPAPTEPAPTEPAAVAPAAVVPPPPARVAASGSSTALAAAPETTPPTPTDALYAAAHRAHFEDRDPLRALAAWDAYLASAPPSARFAPEARYNRALCLIRLGRRAEASDALRPFADGAYGDYRKAEAQKLLGALTDASAP